MANLTPDLKAKRDKKIEEVDEYIAARQIVKARLTENFNTGIAQLDAEIAEHQLIRDGLTTLK